MTPSKTFGAARFAARAAAGSRSLGKPASAYPGAVATDQNLMIAVDRQQTQLGLTLNASDTSMTVVDPSRIAANNLLSIDNEIVRTAGAPSGNVVPIARGFDGTTPAIHLVGALVSGFVDAYHHNTLAAEIEAIETALGPHLINVPGSSSLVSSGFIFPPQSPGGSLIVGANTITLAPVPAGVNGSDLDHYLYISGGTGAPESALIIGGSAVGGSPSGTLIVQCAHAHSGAWTIQSSTAGIQEAMSVAVQNGANSVSMPSGISVLHSRLHLPSNFALIGAGRGITILQVAAGEFQGVPWWSWGGEYVAIGSQQTSEVTLRSFTVDMQGSTQTSAPNQSYGILFVNVNYSRIDDTEVNNGPILTALNTFLPYAVNGTSANNLILGNFVYNLVGTVSGQGSGGFMVFGSNNRVIGNYCSNGCNANYVSGGTNNVFMGNVFELLGSTQVAGSQAFCSDNGVNTTFVGNVCIGNGTGPCAFAVTTDNSSPPASCTTFTGNIAVNCGQGYQLSPNVALITDVAIQGGAVVNCAVPFIITGPSVRSVSVSGVTGLLNGHADSCNQYFSLVNGANQNVNPGDSGILRITGPSAAFSIGGFSGGIDGRELLLLNTTGQPLTINNADPGSLAANRIATGGSNVTLTHSTVTFRYSLLDTVWFMIFPS